MAHLNTEYIKEHTWDALWPVRRLSMQSEIGRFQLGIRYPSFICMPPNSPLHPDMAIWNDVIANYLIQSSIIIESDQALKCFNTFLENYPSMPSTIGFLELPNLLHFPGNQPRMPNHYWRNLQLLAASQLPTLSRLRITLRASGLTEEIPEGDDDRRTIALEGMSHEYQARRPISFDTLRHAYDMDRILQCRFLTFLDIIVVIDPVYRRLCAPADPCEPVHTLAEWFRQQFRSVRSQQVWVRIKIELEPDELGSEGSTMFLF